jgi:hypothetical protein
MLASSWFLQEQSGLSLKLFCKKLKPNGFGVMSKNLTIGSTYIQPL